MSATTPTASVLPFFLSAFAFLWGLCLIPMHRWAFTKPDIKRNHSSKS